MVMNDSCWNSTLESWNLPGALNEPQGCHIDFGDRAAFRRASGVGHSQRANQSGGPAPRH
jgi:hypothetical protein